MSHLLITDRIEMFIVLLQTASIVRYAIAW